MFPLIRKILDIEFIRFAITGLVNTAFGYLIYAVSFLIVKDKNVALLLDYFFSILFNFKSYAAITFKSTDNRRIVRFIGVYCFAIFINFLSLKLFCDILKYNPYIGQLITLTYIPVILYFLLKYFVFHQPEQKSQGRQP
jgi:putative flippase GtrA